MIIFSKFYQILLNFNFKVSDSIDYVISKLSKKIYCITPFISVQKDFGYSDVTQMNNGTNRVHKLFINSAIHAKIYDKLTNYYNFRIKSKNNCTIPDNLYINAYLLKPDSDWNNNHVKESFLGKKEFKLKFINKNYVDPLGRRKAIFKIINDATLNNDDAIIIFSQNHNFTNTYDNYKLFESIFNANLLGCDILSGGAFGYNLALPINEDLFWVDQFFLSSFTVIFKKFFKIITEKDEIISDCFEISCSQLTSQKMLMYPFISTPKSPSNIIVSSKSSIEIKLDDLFKISESKLSSYNKIKFPNSGT